MTPPLRRSAWAVGLLLLLVAGAVGAAHWPVTTWVGINYQVSRKRLPLYEKWIHFLDRHLQARRLAWEITRGARSDEEKLMRVFDWVSEGIRPTPQGFPVVDDHLWNVVIRGYGASDQKTEVFALLASYCGFPSTTVSLRIPESVWTLNLALVELPGKVVVFDLCNNLLFKDENGRFLSLEEVGRDPDRVAAVSAGLRFHGLPYQGWLRRLNGLQPSFLRMEYQKPWPRLREEILRRLKKDFIFKD